MKFAKTIFLGTFLTLALILTSLGNIAKADWQPQRPIEFVIMAGQGGGADRLARFIQSIIETHDLSPQPVIPINKGGGSGAEALRYLKDSAGNPHIVMATLNSYYTTPLRNPGLGVNIEEFTPIARLAEDTFILWVNSETDIMSVDDYVTAVKAAGSEDWIMGGTGTGQEDSLVTGMLQTAYGFEVTYVPYSGGGTVAKNLIGNHVNSTVNNPSEQMGFYEAGQSRPLAALTPERIPAFPDVPTFAELGHPELVYFMQRSVVAPGGIEADVQAFYRDLFEKVYASDEWKEYCSSKALQCAWLVGDELQSYFTSERDKHEEMLRAAGEIE